MMTPSSQAQEALDLGRSVVTVASQKHITQEQAMSHDFHS
jgi:hypothetical protein